MLDRDFVAENYFDGVKPKHLRLFEETTPKGNQIKGYINQKPNKYLGSMLICTVNDETVNQFIQSMPKIHYFKNEYSILKHTETPNTTSDVYPCYEKLDGSCLILYPLKNHNGEIIEVVPKTRGRPVADQHFIDLYHKIDQKPINDYYLEKDGILIFELYGILNQHEVINYNTGIDIRLIAVYENGGFNNIKEIVEDDYHFKLPDKIFELYNISNDWYLKWTSEKYASYKPKEFNGEDKYYPTNIDAVLGIKHELEELNKKFNNVNGRLALEGVVINTFREDGSLKWLKCKPRDIEVKHKTVNGIPRRSITKECLKYFDEYGSQVKEIYQEDPNHHTEYLHRQLSEEYNDDLILKSKKNIEKVFMQIWESKEIPINLHQLADELIEKYPHLRLPELMAVFANEYPHKKKDARLIYRIIEKKFIKKGNEL